MNRYGSLSDDFYVNMNLSTEMDLPASRETVLHMPNYYIIRKQIHIARNISLYRICSILLAAATLLLFCSSLVVDGPVSFN